PEVAMAENAQPQKLARGAAIPFFTYNKALQQVLDNLQCKWVSTAPRHGLDERQHYDFLCTGGNWGTVTLMFDKVAVSKPQKTEAVEQVRLLWREWDPRVNPVAGEGDVAAAFVRHVNTYFVPQKYAMAVQHAFLGAKRKQWQNQYVTIRTDNELREGYMLHKLTITGRAGEVLNNQNPLRYAQPLPQQNAPVYPKPPRVPTQAEREVIDWQMERQAPRPPLSAPVAPQAQEQIEWDSPVVPGQTPVLPAVVEEKPATSIITPPPIADTLVEEGVKTAPLPPTPPQVSQQADVLQQKAMVLGTFDENGISWQSPRRSVILPELPRQPAKPVELPAKAEVFAPVAAEPSTPVTPMPKATTLQPVTHRLPTAKELPEYKANVRIRDDAIEINGLSAGRRLLETLRHPMAEGTFTDDVLRPATSGRTLGTAGIPAYDKAQSLTDEYTKEVEKYGDKLLERRAPVPLTPQAPEPLQALELQPEQVAPMVGETVPSGTLMDAVPVAPATAHDTVLSNPFPDLPEGALPPAQPFSIPALPTQPYENEGQQL
ncbi:MAG: hypothetical protein WAX89_00505, partial [Alphaproteobacteria bacterium]